ncbi:MAG TPA: response regulator transcription factor [Verrucomicrobiota bacterium]|nr:response regulator transcription factor [Verrucomicrobiota bacterium]HQB17077.1 response regulator transcription factor [Verrucomicrobiota bacterium]
MSNRRDRLCKRFDPPRRLALVDADRHLHAAVREHLSKPEAGWHVEAYTSTKAAWPGIASVPPCVVLMDVFPPTATGLDCLRALRARLPSVPVVVYTAQDDAGLLLRTLSAGARGYLIKPLPPADLLPHLHKVLDGGLALCEKAERLLLEGLRGLWLQHSALRLTWAEQQVMLCLCLHRRNKDCARALRISEATVHAHLASIYKKLNVHNRESAIQVFTQKLHGGGVKWPGAASAGLDRF